MRTRALNKQFLGHITPIFIVMLLSILAAAATGVSPTQDGLLRMTEVFLGTFFVAVGMIKLINLKRFVEIFKSYDIVGRRIIVYGYIYPFVELLLGLAFIGRIQLPVISIACVTIIVLSLISVVRVLYKNEHPRCACLGSTFFMRVTWVSFVEFIILLGCAIYVASNYLSL